MRKFILFEGILLLFLVMSSLYTSANKKKDIKFLNSFGLNAPDENSLIPIRKTNEKIFFVQYFLNENCKNHKNSDIFIISEVYTGDTIRYLFELLYGDSRIDSSYFIQNPELKNQYFSSVYESIYKMSFFKSIEISFYTKTRILLHCISVIKSINQSESGGNPWCIFNISPTISGINGSNIIYNESSLAFFEKVLLPNRAFYKIPVFWKYAIQPNKYQLLSECYFGSFSTYTENAQLFRLKLFEKNKEYLKSLIPQIRADLSKQKCIFLYTLPDLRLYKICLFIEIKKNTCCFGVKEQYMNQKYNLNLKNYDFRHCDSIKFHSFFMNTFENEYKQLCDDMGVYYSW